MKREVDYVAFVLGRGMLDEILPYEDDYAYDKCCEYAEAFMESEYNNEDRDLYSCIEDYVKSINLYWDLKLMKNSDLISELKYECRANGNSEYIRKLQSEINRRMLKEYYR